ncbi:MAG: DegT/DnrJ/EryC1/StrS family aminotransferase [Candidatus Bathyarchaeia archaeon]
MTKIPLIKPDLPSLEAIEKPFREILESGKITNFGKYVAAFEEEASAYLGTQVVTVSSGTMGLIFALQALGLQPGQKVILPSFTFMATAQAVLYAGGVPVFAEIENDLTLSPSDLEALLSRHKDVAIVLPVHTYGLPCRVDEIQQVVDEASRRLSRPIAVLYDAAHAFGAALKDGRRVGTFGTAEVFSLSVTKVLVSVEGGMVSSRNPEIIERIRKMRNYGIEANYDAHWPGLNGKMSEFHAIIGLYNLRRLDALLQERARKARYYIEQIRTHTHFEPPPWPEGVTHTFKDFTVLVPEALSDRRDAVMAVLGERGVETRAYFYPPVHEQWFFRRFADRPLPRTEALARRVITIPFYTTITEEEMDYVVKALQEAERRVL